MNELTEEQKECILLEYGTTNEIIKRIETVLCDIPFTEEEYFELITEIVSEYETNQLKKSLINPKDKNSKKEIYKNLKEIIIHVLKFKLNSYSEEQKNYKILIKTLNELKEKNQI